MKINFNTVLTGTDPSGDPVTLTAAQQASLVYTCFIDTVNPPVKSYAVPAANLQNASPNADGTKRVTVDAVNDLKIALVPGDTYYIAIQDSMGGTLSPETAVITYLDTVTPSAPGNPTVA